MITSEMSYLPLFVEKCEARGTAMHIITDRDAEMIPDDFLDLFPYREHPRNIALVTKVATELGLDPDLARYTMAMSVVPDLGVLKAYPKVRARGRLLTFVCGNSANERTAATKFGHRAGAMPHASRVSDSELWSASERTTCTTSGCLRKIRRRLP